MRTLAGFAFGVQSAKCLCWQRGKHADPPCLNPLRSAACNLPAALLYETLVCDRDTSHKKTFKVKLGLLTALVGVPIFRPAGTIMCIHGAVEKHRPIYTRQRSHTAVCLVCFQLTQHEERGATAARYPPPPTAPISFALFTIPGAEVPAILTPPCWRRAVTCLMVTAGHPAIVSRETPCQEWSELRALVRCLSASNNTDCFAEFILSLPKGSQ